MYLQHVSRRCQCRRKNEYLWTEKHEFLSFFTAIREIFHTNSHCLIHTQHESFLFSSKIFSDLAQIAFRTDCDQMRMSTIFSMCFQYLYKWKGTSWPFSQCAFNAAVWTKNVCICFFFLIFIIRENISSHHNHSFSIMMNCKAHTKTHSNELLLSVKSSVSVCIKYSYSFAISAR